ncbi:MAG: AraC family transcriptional regulator ligand-binding domain-containing protein [Pseudomonadota bacterium]
MQIVTALPEPAVSYPVTYSRLIARELRLDGQGLAALLAGTGLALADLGGLDREISAAGQVALLRNALALAGRPGLGLEIGSRLPLAAHGPLGQLLSASPDLGEAWAALERFHGLRVPLVSFRRSFAQGDMQIRLELECDLDEVGLFLVEAMVVTIQRGIELIIGQRLRGARLDLAYAAPAHGPLYDKFLHGTLRFRAPATAWHIPAALLAQPNPFHDPVLYRQALRACEQLEAARREGAAVAWSVRLTQLLQQHPGKLWTLPEVAAHWHLSARTLIRYLRAEDTTWQAVLDRELARQALELFAENRQTVESVALALGYHDATAFRRAFRRWFGEAPTVWLARGGLPHQRTGDTAP